MYRISEDVGDFVSAIKKKTRGTKTLDQTSKVILYDHVAPFSTYDLSARHVYHLNDVKDE